MSSVVPPGSGGVALTAAGAPAPNLSRLWWLWLVTGCVWLTASLVILQFDSR